MSAFWAEISLFSQQYLNYYLIVKYTENNRPIYLKQSNNPNNIEI